MKTALALVVCLLAVSSTAIAQSPAKKLGFDGNDFFHIVEGLLEGIGAAESWSDVQPCIDSTEDAVQNVITAVEYFEKEDPVSVAYGLAALAKAFEDLPTAIKSCVASAEDVEILIKALEAISNPYTYVFVVAKNLIVNGVDIYDEIYTAVGDFKAGNWKDFGFNIGEALAKIFFNGVDSRNSIKLNFARKIFTLRQQLKVRGRVQKLSSAKDVLLFLKGTVEGISTDPLYDQFAPCVENSTEIGSMIETAINDFISQETSRVIEGVKLLGQALFAIPVAMRECGSAAGPQLQNLVDAISQLKDPRTIVYRFARSLIINGDETWDKITECQTHFSAGEYEKAGNAVGIILTNFIRPDDAVAGLRFTKFLEKRAPFRVNHNHKFANWTKGQLKTLFGTKLENPAETGIPVANNHLEGEKLPDNFSAYTQWPQCAKPVIDQAQCGSCWAFGAAETLTDRFCIASGGKVNVTLSPQYLVSCSTFNMGCNGGTLTVAWKSLEISGLPTLECTPYTSQSGDVASCSDLEKGCTDGSSLKKYYAESWSTMWYISANSIKKEIMTNGPVESAFTVYEDFMSYAGGVYKHTSGSELGGHAIKIIGWGVEDGQEYWLVQNSWGEDWGEKGYFRMAIGDSSMDYNGVAGAADIKNLPKKYYLIDGFLSA